MHAYHALIFDAFLIGGFPYFHFDFERRLRAISTCLQSYLYRPTDSVYLEVKAFTRVQRDMHPPTDCRFFNDGFIFMPNEHPVVFGQHDALFKLKTIHSVDFLYRNGCLFIYNTKTRRHVKAGILEEQHGKVLEDGHIVECVLVQDEKVMSRRIWKIIKIRMDKDRANSLFVMEKTLINAIEKLSFGDITQVITDSAL